MRGGDARCRGTFVRERIGRSGAVKSGLIARVFGTADKSNLAIAQAAPSTCELVTNDGGRACAEHARAGEPRLGANAETMQELLRSAVEAPEPTGQPRAQPRRGSGGLTAQGRQPPDDQIVAGARQHFDDLGMVGIGVVVE